MVRRCKDPKNINYPNYGSRGISVYEEWAERGLHGTTKTPQGFLRFLEYVDNNLGDKPKGYSLDRIDNDGDYVPGNIRWADSSTQGRNRRCSNEYHRINNVAEKTKYQHMGNEMLDHRDLIPAWEKDFIDILKEDWYQHILPLSWDMSPCRICSRQCGKDKFTTVRQHEGLMK